jgi:uncharacterized membrane protein (GlpM family)
MSTLLFKCLCASAIMIGIHFLSRTPNYFLSALLLSFPGLSMTAYWFMFRELGAQKVIDTAHFGAGTGVAFIAFLFGMSWALRRHGIGTAFAVGLIVWLLFAGGWIVAWKMWLGH